MKKTLADYRKGAVGSLMDEYERAVLELKSIVLNVSEEDYARIADAKTEDEACRSIQTIMSHVIFAAYGYANYIRESFAVTHSPTERKQISHAEIGDAIDKVLAYTIETLNGRWEMTDDEMDNAIINTRWGIVYNLEQLLEHAIVHILRHRRQIDKYLLKFEMENLAFN